MAPAARIASLLVVLLLTSTVAQAQHRWNGPHPHWYRDWLWWAGEAVIAAIEATDAHSTILARERCPGCIETNRFIGPRPSRGDVILLTTVSFGIQSLLHWGSWETCPDPNHEFRSWRVACDMLVPGIGIAVRGKPIAHNYHLASQFKSATPSSSSMTIQSFQLGGISGTPTGPSNWILSPGNQLPFYVKRQLSGCGQNLTLCPSFQPTTQPKIDLRSVHFR
jgi:hypothetical protein